MKPRKVTNSAMASWMWSVVSPYGRSPARLKPSGSTGSGVQAASSRTSRPPSIRQPPLSRTHCHLIRYQPCGFSEAPLFDWRGAEGVRLRRLRSFVVPAPTSLGSACIPSRPTPNHLSSKLADVVDLPGDLDKAEGGVERLTPLIGGKRFDL